MPGERRELAEPQRNKEASAVIGGGPEGTLQDQNLEEVLDLTLNSRVIQTENNVEERNGRRKNI